MTRASLLAAAVGLATGLNTGRAAAQPPVPGGGASIQRPAFSPYLNLLRPGASPTLNYYGLVRPEQQFRQSIGTLQGSVAANQQAIGGLQSEVEGVPATGHPTQFLNYGGYFLSSGPGSAGAGSRPGGTMGGQRAGGAAFGGAGGAGGARGGMGGGGATPRR